VCQKAISMTMRFVTTGVRRFLASMPALPSTSLTTIFTVRTGGMAGPLVAR